MKKKQKKINLKIFIKSQFEKFIFYRNINESTFSNFIEKIEIKKNKFKK